MTKRLITALGFLFSLIGLANSSDAFLPQPLCTYVDYPVEVGFPFSSVVEKVDGTVYLASHMEGVFELRDGNQEAIGLPGVALHKLELSADGQLFAAGDRGIYRYDGQQEWTRLFPDNDAVIWVVMDFEVQPDGVIWAGTMWGIVQLDKGVSTLYAAPEQCAGLKRFYPNMVMTPIAMPQEMSAWGYNSKYGLRAMSSFSLGGKTYLATVADEVASETGLMAGDEILAVDDDRPPMILTQSNLISPSIQVTFAGRDGVEPHRC